MHINIQRVLQQIVHAIGTKSLVKLLFRLCKRLRVLDASCNIYICTHKILLHNFTHNQSFRKYLQDIENLKMLLILE